MCPGFEICPEALDEPFLKLKSEADSDEGAESQSSADNCDHV